MGMIEPEAHIGKLQAIGFRQNRGDGLAQGFEIGTASRRRAGAPVAVIGGRRNFVGQGGPPAASQAWIGENC